MQLRCLLWPWRLFCAWFPAYGDVSGPSSGGRNVRRIFSIVLAILVLVLAKPLAAGELSARSFPSPALKRDMKFAVYLPDGYPSGRDRYPVLYLLHGSGTDESVWAERGQVKTRFDDLIARGVIPPTIIVMPSCAGAWWVDGARDRAESAFWSDLVPFVDATYRTMASKQGRLIAGLSAGGYGAVRFALKYPDKIAAVAAFSPAVYAVTPPARSAARRDPAFLRADGQFDQSAWAAQNYVRLADPYFQHADRVAVYLVSGDGDELGIAFETVLLFKTMLEGQPDLAELRIIDGRHDWNVWGSAMEDAVKYLYHFVPRSHAGMPQAR